ncbi:GGDEF domain-containing protein [uncultured Vibrio sp.]|uniref:GGDEF domain-containing protein n=1 Tax=uncultured Vibrio sp. TaxID=114054 RepID=UPI00091FDE9A|nr:GGDEF domain-containing protein [uncultured Vibrio sp.]OIQ26596.1 MAG: GGDEF domain-containing protein [Vibrio sp. MedPE-SWchi]
MSVEQKILQSVIEITEQTNSISLAHCVIATLAEMIPIQSVHLFHYSGNVAHLTAAVCREVDADGQVNYHWIHEDDKTISMEFDHSLSKSSVEELGDGLHQCTFPIKMDGDSSARFIVSMRNNPKNYLLLMEGFCQIYRNYLTILHESERDELTGLYNRKVLDQKLTLSFDSVADGDFDSEYSPRVAILDIDRFKSVNDTYGHMIGDEVLLIFAQQMQQYFDHEEQLFRFGGEEFVVLFPRTKLSDALERMEGFRKHVEGYDFPQVSNVTFSAGICSVKTSSFVSNILDHADKALYYAKDHGRNQVCSYQWLVNDSDEETGDSDVELF